MKAALGSARAYYEDRKADRSKQIWLDPVTQEPITNPKVHVDGAIPVKIFKSFFTGEAKRFFWSGDGVPTPR